MRIVVILLFALAAPVSAVGSGDRSSTFARLAYARSPDFLTTLDAASTKHSQGPLAESNSAPRLRVLTVAAARHLAGCAATLRSPERATSAQRAQLLAAKFIPPAELSVRDKTGRPAELETSPSAELAPRKGTVEAIEPATEPELAARSQTIEVIAAEMLPSAELAAHEKTLETMDAQTPPPVAIAARGETVAVAEAGTHTVEELAHLPLPEMLPHEALTPKQVAARRAPAQAAAHASAHQRSARAKSRRKSAARLAKRRRRVAQQRRAARVRRPERPVVTATYTEKYADRRRGSIPASAEKMYDANWQRTAFTYQ